MFPLIIIAAALLLARRTGPGATALPVAAAGGPAMPASTLGTITVPQNAAGPANVIGGQAEGLAINTGINLATTAASTAIAGGAVGASLAAGALTAGIGTAAVFGVEAVSDLFKCGTIGHIGCQKRDDATTQIKGIELMKQAMFAVESGQATPAAAAQRIQSIAAQVYSAYENKASGNHFTMSISGSDAGIPPNSLSAKFMLNQATSLQDMTNAFVGYLPTLAAAAAGQLPVPAPGGPSLPAPLPVATWGGMPALSAGGGGLGDIQTLPAERQLQEVA